MKSPFWVKRLNNYVKMLESKPAISLVINVAKELGEDRAGDMAGSIAYYAILSLFPLLLGVISLLGLFLPSQSFQDQILLFIGRYFPGANDLIQQNIMGVIELRGTLGFLALLGLFWTGSVIFGAIGRVINEAWDVNTYRPFYLRKLRDISLAIGTSIIFFLSMASTALASIAPIINLPIWNLLAVIIVRVTGFALIFALFLLMYKFMPNANTSWKYIWPAAILASVLFEIARTAFSFYLTNFASYDKVYGSLAAIIILLVWIYYSAFIIILGAEFASEYVKFIKLKSRR